MHYPNTQTRWISQQTNDESQVMHTNANGYAHECRDIDSDANEHSDRDQYGDIDSHPDEHSDANEHSDRDQYGDIDSHPDEHSDANEHSDRDQYGDIDSYPHKHGDANGYGNADTNIHTHEHRNAVQHANGRSLSIHYGL